MKKPKKPKPLPLEEQIRRVRAEEIGQKISMIDRERLNKMWGAKERSKKVEGKK